MTPLIVATLTQAMRHVLAFGAAALRATVMPLGPSVKPGVFRLVVALGQQFEVLKTVVVANAVDVVDVMAGRDRAVSLLPDPSVFPDGDAAIGQRDPNVPARVDDATALPRGVGFPPMPLLAACNGTEMVLVATALRRLAQVEYPADIAGVLGHRRAGAILSTHRTCLRCQGRGVSAPPTHFATQKYTSLYLVEVPVN